MEATIDKKPFWIQWSHFHVYVYCSAHDITEELKLNPMEHLAQVVQKQKRKQNSKNEHLSWTKTIERIPSNHLNMSHEPMVYDSKCERKNTFKSFDKFSKMEWISNIDVIYVCLAIDDTVQFSFYPVFFSPFEVAFEWEFD